MRSAFFLDGAAGRILCVGDIQSNGSQPQSAALIVAPFGEEMNKSRHVLAALARRLADAGYAVLLPDLYGTGDSEGDFSDATLAIWRSDIDKAIEALNASVPIDLIGLRAGALLAADAVSRHTVRSLNLLHPIADGRQQLTQLLRLRLAGGLLGGEQKETAAELKQRLADGETLEIAGYGISSTLAADLETLALGNMSLGNVQTVNWVELAPEADRPLMPVSQRLVDAWREEGLAIEAAVVACDQFWATQEIAQCPGIVDKALEFITG